MEKFFDNMIYVKKLENGMELHARQALGHNHGTKLEGYFDVEFYLNDSNVTDDVCEALSMKKDELHALSISEIRELTEDLA